jgi:hypothetical protein
MATKKKQETPKPYSDTTVRVEKSRADIEGLLKSYGVTRTQWTNIDDSSILRFEIDVDGTALMVRLVVDPKRHGSKPSSFLDVKKTEKHWERESMRLHRSLFHAVKAKLDTIASGLESPLSAWLPSIESGGQTVGERAASQIGNFALPDRTMGGFLSLPETKRK